jgi:hypothetical protein
MPACRVPILSTDPAPASATTDHLILRSCKETVQAAPNASRLRCRFRGVRLPYVPWPCRGLALASILVGIYTFAAAMIGRMAIINAVATRAPRP